MRDNISGEASSMKFLRTADRSVLGKDQASMVLVSTSLSFVVESHQGRKDKDLECYQSRTSSIFFRKEIFSETEFVFQSNCWANPFPNLPSWLTACTSGYYICDSLYCMACLVSY
ncbi:Stromal interaction molecule-like protein [Frankliniella fusca]|uniref:Stromal interaction molecule-like protein n=1 Tax=Frankliniella fusca TaxID=407009 RepID=A0AAE1LG55_9NEOP|nr:Stromal interaction molecule-like protein [Frankliniella fusca]